MMGKTRKRPADEDADSPGDLSKKNLRDADGTKLSASDPGQLDASDSQSNTMPRSEREGSANDESSSHSDSGELMRELECPICKQCVRDAHITRCGHTFCYQCVFAAANAKRGCPQCLAPLDSDSIIPNFAINQLANKANRLLAQRRSESVIRDALLMANDADSLDAVASIAKRRADALRSETDASRAAMCKLFLERLDSKLAHHLEELITRRSAISADLVACSSILHSGSELSNTERIVDSSCAKAEKGETSAAVTEADSRVVEAACETTSIPKSKTDRFTSGSPIAIEKRSCESNWSDVSGISVRQRAKMSALFESLSTVYFQLKQSFSSIPQPQDQTVANDSVADLELASNSREDPTGQNETTGEPRPSSRTESDSASQHAVQADAADVRSGSNESELDGLLGNGTYNKIKLSNQNDVRRPIDDSVAASPRASATVEAKRVTTVRRGDPASTALDDGGVLDEFSRVLQKALRFGAARELCAFAFCGDLGGSSRVVSSCEWDETGSKLAVAGITKRIKIYDLDTLLMRGGVLDPLHGASSGPRFRSGMDEPEESNAHLPYADLATVYADQEIACDAKISCVAWNHFFRTQLASSDYDGHVLLWDAVTGVKLHDYADHEKRAWAVDFNRHDHTLFASGSDDTRVRVWSSAQRSCVHTLSIGANVCSVQFALTSRYMLAVGAADHNIYLYDLRSVSRPLHTVKESAKAVSYVKFLLPSESDSLLSGISHQFPTQAAAPKRYDRFTSSVVAEWEAASRRTDRTESLRQSLADTGSQKKALERINRATERGETSRFTDTSPSGSPSQCVADSAAHSGSSNGSTMNLVSASTDSSLKIWRFESRRGVIPAQNDARCGLLRTLRGHVNEKNFVGLTTDLNDYVVCGSENNTLYCYYKHLDRPLLAYRFSEPPAPSLAPTNLFRSTSFAGSRSNSSRAGLDVSGLRSALEPAGLPMHGALDSPSLRGARGLETPAGGPRSRLDPAAMRCIAQLTTGRESNGDAFRHLDAANWRLGMFDRQFSHDEVSNTTRTDTHHASSSSNSHDFVSAVAWRLRSNILAVGNSQGIVKLLELY